jgi:hypothetical protein
MDEDGGGPRDSHAPGCRRSDRLLTAARVESNRGLAQSRKMIGGANLEEARAGDRAGAAPFPPRTQVLSSPIFTIHESVNRSEGCPKSETESGCPEDRVALVAHHLGTRPRDFFEESSVLTRRARRRRNSGRSLKAPATI